MAKNCRLCCLIFCLCGIFCAAQRSWGGDAGVAVHIHTSKQTYEAGEPIDLLADTAASRDTSLMETHTNCLFEYDFDVVLPNKDPAPLTVYGKWLKAGNAYSGVQGWQLLKSSASTNHLHLNRLVDMTLAGEYQITIKQRFRNTDPKKPEVTVTSNTIRVKVTNFVTVPTTGPATRAAGG